MTEASARPMVRSEPPALALESITCTFPAAARDDQPYTAVREASSPGDKEMGREDEPVHKRLESSRFQEIPVRVELVVRFDVAKVPAATGGLAPRVKLCEPDSLTGPSFPSGLSTSSTLNVLGWLLAWKAISTLNPPAVR